MQTLKKFKSLKEKRILVRCDFNVPLGVEGNILCDFRIKQIIPTIEYLVKGGARVILMSHLGRPEGREIKYSLKPVALKLEELLNKRVVFLSDYINENTEKYLQKMQSGEILLLENLRFYKEEEKNDENFAKKLSKLGVFYINDAFSASHRAHASIVGIPKYLPSVAGLLLEKEIKILTNLIKNPKRPLVTIIGGKKVETKTKLINKIAEIGDFILVGDLIKKELKEKNIQFKESQKIIEPIEDMCGKDISPQTINLFKEKIALAKTIFWNGPLGMIEEKEFSQGSEEIARAIIKSNAFSIVGGGETVEFINRLSLAKKFNHLSTGGGAMLEFLSGEELPGLKALK